MARYNSKNTTVVIQDGGSLDVTVGPGEGNLTIDNITNDNSEKLAAMNRGVFDGLFEGADLTQSFSITIQVKNEALTHGTNDRVLDAIRKTGAWAAGTTTNPNGSVWAFKLVVTMNDGVTTSTITLPCCVATANFSESMDGHTLNISGTNYQAPTIT